MSDAVLSILCLVATLVLYYANKKLYRRFHKLPLMPLVFTPILLVLILVVGHISFQSYMGETHWLLWLLGPATIAFAVPVYENVAVIKTPLDVAQRRGGDGGSGGCHQFRMAGARVYVV